MAATNTPAGRPERPEIGENDIDGEIENAGRAAGSPGAPAGPVSSECAFDRSAARAALIQVAGSALANMGVEEPTRQLLEPLARVIIDLVK